MKLYVLALKASTCNLICMFEKLEFIKFYEILCSNHAG